MARPKIPKETQPLLGETPPPASTTSTTPPAALIEYVVDGRPWRCSKFDLLAVELDAPVITSASLPLLQIAVEGREKTWLILRRLFGLMPVTPPKNYPLDDMRTWTREALRDVLGLTAVQLQAELDVVRGIWKQIAPKPVQTPAPPPEKTLFADDEVLKKYEFRVSLPDMDERTSFVKRVREFEKLLAEPMTAGIARNALMTELQLRRLDEQMSDVQNGRVGSSGWQANMRLRSELDKTYSDQMAKLDKLAPWSGAVAGKYSFKGQISDITAAYQAYYADRNNQLRDGIFTATEIEVECRQSVQAPEPRYRAGLVVHLAHCREGLFDPNFKPQFTERQLGKLDKAWKAAFIAAGVENGEALVDLEKDGPEGEYPKLKAAETV